MVKMSFWQGKKVFITGHTGFKGSWLLLWLQSLGAHVTGFSLSPESDPNLFSLANAADGIVSVKGDIRNSRRLNAAMKRCRPDIVFHLAAQSLVRASYRLPVETFDVNVVGTANVLEAVRSSGATVRAVIIVTSDKCYENREWIWPYRETDRLGGYDPYSASKACAELVTDAFRRSFFAGTPTALSTVRSGNVIGGGDWAQDRLVPDLIRSLLSGKTPKVREPLAVRPWQHVLDPLQGYLLLAERMYAAGEQLGQAWNFGPDNAQPLTVGEIARELLACWDELELPSSQIEDAIKDAAAPFRDNMVDLNDSKPHEAQRLVLDCSKARTRLGWRPLLDTKEAIRWTADWYQAYAHGKSVRVMTLKQIEAYKDLQA
ncbi:MULTISPECIES: CDP-glucose 4,6-dehydratase [unclassified Paenibacillus]|uniref:CDP-glucose 4,6-dehydratase n=1 Tax=unclassified Paenibacillus TaxID=185978 RepID=UPI003638163C